MVMTQFLLALFISDVFCGWTKYFPRLYSLYERNVDKNPPIELNEVLHDYYYTVNNNRQELNVFSQIHQINSNNVEYSNFYNSNDRTVLVLKTIKHRNKRYTSYLTLCPFKICNMGRKRTRAKRFINKIKSSGDGRYAS